ncbi:flagellar hook-associated protein 3 [Nocardioides sp. GY 10113]|uniref:flagellar hook-associated protein FlgL n=1 Tax=Nocardioides sp. GY 10113 TaxID=2569761 RepID=UPI0010A77450|nr:flagellar hook-associated protein FlgL [Nocardioides sp. GY 10113]TIC85968.1 flagellar hook-associated protein 3 [Nocardioides sp. GY 10113]
MSLGRVTQRMLNRNGLESVQTGLTRLGKVQEQLTTGRILNRPSDSPSDTTAAMRIRASLADQTQYSRNAQDGLGWMEQVDSTLDTVTNALSRARELASQAVSGAVGQASRDALAQEIDGIRANMITLANATYLDRPVFGGITAGGVAYDDTGTYVGAAGEVTRRVADGVTLRVDVDGVAVFGSGAGSVFDELGSLATALRAGDIASVQGAGDSLKTRVDTVVSARTAAGVSYQRLQRADTAAGNAELSLTSRLSTLENTDLAKATMDLELQEVAYQASLAATARVMQPSLLDFIR